MGTRTARGLTAFGVMATIFLFVAPAAWSAGTRASTVPSRRSTVSVTSTQVWTDSHVALHAGDFVTITAAGAVHFGRAPIDEVAPSGFAWGSRCFVIGRSGSRWPAAGLRCWSLIARIGTGPPFQVGASASRRVRVDGELQLGVNDNYLADNRGGWSANVTVATATGPVTANAISGLPPAGSATSQTNDLADQTLRGLLISLLAATLVGVVIWRINAARRPRLTLAPELRVGQMKVGITGEHSIVRLGPDDVWRPFFLTPDDFVDLLHATHEHFAWHGLHFRAAKSRIPFAPAYGEVLRVGQHVAASGGLIRGRDGYLKGRVPLVLRDTWTFTLDAVIPNPTREQPGAEGELTMFIVSDQPFESQAHEIYASLRTLPDNLGRLMKARQATIALQARLLVSRTTTTGRNRAAYRPNDASTRHVAEEASATTTQ